MKAEVLNKLLDCCEKEYLHADYPIEKEISEQDISQIVVLFRHLLFPEYMGINLQFDKERLKRYIERFWNKIAIAVESLGNQEEKYKDYIADTVVKRISELRTEIKKDIQAVYEGDPAAHSYKEIVLAYPGVLAIMIYRLASILGGKTIIGKGTVVGSNAFITKSVESNTKICIMQ